MTEFAPLQPLFEQFQLAGALVEICALRSGHINDTYASRVSLAGGGSRRYIHQRINGHVFQHPALVMENIARVTAHARHEIVAQGGDPARQCLTLIPTRGGAPYLRAASGEIWRTYDLIEGAHTREVAENPRQVYEAARAFGRFQRLLSSLPGARLHETIPGFHHTPGRLLAFAQAVQADSCGRAAETRAEIDFILAREADTRAVTDRLASGALPERVTHNDTKLNNVLLDDRSGEGICVLDLDTVMPGSALYDFGDMVRAGAATAAEDEPDLTRVTFDLEAFRQLAAGYTETAREFLTPLEWDLLAFAGRLITLEQGMRFLGDYLQGDTYYKTQRPGQNLDRARTQLKLVAEMEARSADLETVIAEAR